MWQYARYFDNIGVISYHSTDQNKAITFHLLPSSCQSPAMWKTLTRQTLFIKTGTLFGVNSLSLLLRSSPGAEVCVGYRASVITYWNKLVWSLLQWPLHHCRTPAKGDWRCWWGSDPALMNRWRHPACERRCLYHHRSGGRKIKCRSQSKSKIKRKCYLIFVLWYIYPDKIRQRKKGYCLDVNRNICSALLVT